MYLKYHGDIPCMVTVKLNRVFILISHTLILSNHRDANVIYPFLSIYETL